MMKSKPKVSSAKVSMWWFPALVISLILLGSSLVLWPQINKIGENRQAFLETEAQLSKAQTKVDQVNQLDAAELDRLSGLVARALPEHKPYFETLITLQQLAGETQVFLQDFKLDPGSLATGSGKVANATKEVTKIATKLSLMGKTDAVSLFIQKLHQALPLITITSISISQNQQITDEDQRMVELKLDLYYAEPINSSSQVSFEPLPQFNQAQQDIFELIAAYTAAVDATASGSFSNMNRTDLFNY